LWDLRSLVDSSPMNFMLSECIIVITKDCSFLLFVQLCWCGSSREEQEQDLITSCHRPYDILLINRIASTNVGWCFITTLLISVNSIGCIQTSYNENSRI
jgi:hypothetical protein